MVPWLFEFEKSPFGIAMDAAFALKPSESRRQAAKESQRVGEVSGFAGVGGREWRVKSFEAMCLSMVPPFILVFIPEWQR